MSKVSIEPPKRKKTGKGNPPPESKPSVNLKKPDTGEFKPLNFSVPAEFREEYKIFAASHNMTMVELLSTTFSHYKNNVSLTE